MKTASKTLSTILGLALIAASAAPAAAGGFYGKGGYRGHAPYGYGKVAPNYGYGYGRPIYRKNSRGGIGAGIAIGALSLLGAAAVASRANAAPAYADPYVPAADTYRPAYGGYDVGRSGSNEFVVGKFRSVRNGIVCETNYGRLFKC